MDKNITRTHSQTAAFLLVACCFGATMFFALTRAFGLLWFQQEYIYTNIPVLVGHIIMHVFWVLDGVIKVRTLTSLSRQASFLVIFLSRVPLFFFAFIPPAVVIAISTSVELSVLFIVPFIFNKNKRRSIGNSVLYTPLILAYQSLMTLGRGYPLIGRFCPTWQIVGTLDYRLFIFGILLLKGVLIKMQAEAKEKGFIDFPPGCWLLWGKGKIETTAEKIGRFVLKPLARFFPEDDA